MNDETQHAEPPARLTKRDLRPAHPPTLIPVAELRRKALAAAAMGEDADL